MLGFLETDPQGRRLGRGQEAFHSFFKELLELLRRHFGLNQGAMPRRATDGSGFKV